MGSPLFVDRELVQPLAVGGLGRVRMRSDVDELVTVRRAAAQEPAFQLRLRGHRGPHPDLDAVPFALGDTAEHGHDQVVRLVLGVDRAADLGRPQRHLVVSEDRERVAELVAVEGALRLPHHDRAEPACRVG